MKIAAPIMVVTAMVLGFTAYGIVRAARESNDASIARQIRVANHNLAHVLTEMAHELEVVAVWDDAVTRTSAEGLDIAWIDENLGVWLHQMFGHDRLYVLNAVNQAVYVMEDGVQTDPQRYAAVRADLAGLVAEVRLFGSLADHKERKSTGRAVHATRLTRVGGRPAVASIMRVVPYGDDGPSPVAGEESLLVAVRFLDGSFLEDLRTRDLMDGARFSVVPDAREGERVLSLMDAEKPIGYLLWRPEAPGAQILHRILPLYALTAVGVVGIMLLLVRVLWKASGELRASEAHAQHLALHDVLTGQPNRALLAERLEQAVARVRRSAPRDETRFALLLLDLDRFKQVNDTLGHQAGDELIREFAARLSALVRRGDLVARLGGDEFAIIQIGIRDLDDVEGLCRRILECAHQPFAFSRGMRANVGVTIGVALAPDTGIDGSDLMRKADIALYRAKAEGRDRYCIFAEGMDASVLERGRIEAELRAALDTGEGLLVHYQPLMSRDGRTLTGLEALIRWDHPVLGMLPPSRFLPVAEECGLSVRLDQWVLDQTCRALPTLPDVPVAVNLSPAQFFTDDLYERLMGTVTLHGVSPRRIELEITERALLDENAACHGALMRLRAAGFRIALDDFGTGYSSLSYLRRFQVDKIKIDQSFVRHLGSSDNSSSIVQAIITMGQSMGVQVTAEGVETSEQLEFLARSGCNQMQGFLFAGAVPCSDLSSMQRAEEARDHLLETRAS
ncbi:putative bifunctional diguanylate cyclase/phosphodiesterase [Arenibaculum pallidiluteum]|uniref:putative bifunctional diguanylate cyclase/phosphodiesterase n=1 Tax=Arenibaculum pallidiluteum TaxID=2812559 RepID=UPI001A96D565|nr:bifunctional diguanylate cyclase/phosphodiesterase [Arenibaculum pallidiluteum]